MTEQSSGGLGKFIGLILMVGAGLWMAFCGLCAFGVLANAVVESNGAAELLGAGLFVLAVSGLSAAAGYAVFTVGRRLFRQS